MTSKPKRVMVPRSQATNAYDLLTDVVTAIRQEPARANQYVWFASGRRKIQQMRFGSRTQKAVPSCGTIGCVAGWCVILAHGKKTAAQMDKVSLNLYGNSIQSNARRLLGMTTLQAADLFGTDGLYSTPGTRKHAADVIAKIRRFQDSHAAELKGKAL